MGGKVPWEMLVMKGQSEVSFLPVPLGLLSRSYMGQQSNYLQLCFKFSRKLSRKAMCVVSYTSTHTP